MSLPALAPPRTLAAIGLVVALSGCKGCQESNLVGRDPDQLDTPFTDDWGSWLSMAALPDGSPALAYYNKTHGVLGFATASFDGDGAVTWAHEQVDGYVNSDGLDVGDRGQYASMAVAGNGTIWIASYDAGVGAMRYATRTASATEWTTGIAETGGGSRPSVGKFASLALDATGAPAIAHWDEGKGQLRIAHWDGSAFSGEVVDEGEPFVPDAGSGQDPADADVGMFARLRIVSGIEYIAYYDAAYGQLKLAWGTRGNYAVEVVDAGIDPTGGSRSDVGQWPDMLIEDGTIHIAYHDVGDGDLRHAVGTPGAWTVETVDDGDYVGADTSLFLNGTTLSVLYHDGRNNDVKMAWKAGDTWQIDNVAGANAALGFHNEAIIAGGRAYAACYDYTNRTLWFSQLN